MQSDESWRGLTNRLTSQETWEQAEDGSMLRRIKVAELYEISPTAMPAYESTSVVVEPA